MSELLSLTLDYLRMMPESDSALPEESATVEGCINCITGAFMAAAVDPLTPRVIEHLVSDFLRHGSGKAVVDLDEDGNTTLTPFRGGITQNGVYTGNTMDHLTLAEEHINVSHERVIDVRLVSGAPRIGPLIAATRALVRIDKNIEIDAKSGMRGRPIIKVDPNFVNTTGKQRDAMANSLKENFSGVIQRDQTPVLPAGYDTDMLGGPEGITQIGGTRAELRQDVQGLMGVNGLLTTDDAQAVHSLWRLAVVRTFVPIARLIEDETESKLDRRVTLNQDAWVIAPIMEQAQGINRRTQALKNLVDAGFDRDEARRIVGL